MFKRDLKRVADEPPLVAEEGRAGADTQVDTQDEDAPPRRKVCIFASMDGAPIYVHTRDTPGLISATAYGGNLLQALGSAACGSPEPLEASCQGDGTSLVKQRDSQERGARRMERFARRRRLWRYDGATRELLPGAP